METISFADVARILGKSERSIARWAKAGDIPAVKIAGSVIIPRAEWEAWWQWKKDKAIAAASEGK